MSFQASQWRVACVLVAAAWAAGAQAAHYPVTGNVRFQIGGGLPIPIGFTGVPAGKIFATPSAVVTQTSTGADPRTITIPPGAFHHGGTPFLLPMYGGAPVGGVLQVMTSIHVTLPATPMVPGDPLLNVLRPGGRTGHSYVAWCPGQPPPTTSYAPNCTSPRNPANLIPARLRYTKTAAQFGGPISSQLGGLVDIAMNPFGIPVPCNFETTTCEVFFVHGPPLQTGAIGGSFGRRTTTTGPAPNPGHFNVVITTNGAIVEITPTGLGPGVWNPASSWAGPWTTGQVANTAVTVGGVWSDMFTRTGSDNRVDGVGTLSLIAGAVSNRASSGSNANRGWLNITVPEPAAVTGAASAFLLLAACHSLVRRRSG